SPTSSATSWSDIASNFTPCRGAANRSQVGNNAVPLPRTASRRAAGDPVAAPPPSQPVASGPPRVIGGTAADRARLPVEPTAALSPAPASAAGRVVDIGSGPLQVRLAQSAADVDAALALRYRIFYEKMGARPLPGMEQRRRDYDGFDEICDHLLVLDHSRGAGPEAVVGTYRLIRRAAAERFGTFYSAAEYDIAPLIAYPGEILELGRSCVDAGYRARPVMQLLWSGIATYVFH